MLNAKRGAELNGATHKDGGIKAIISDSGKIVELEDKEVVLNAKNMQDDSVYIAKGTPKQIASKINELNQNGVKIEDGGEIIKIKDIQDVISRKSKNSKGESIEAAISYIQASKRPSSDAKTTKRIKRQEEVQISTMEMGGEIPHRIYLGEEGGKSVSSIIPFYSAIKMERDGVDGEKIRQITGWFRNPFDKMWRYEISDKDSVFDDQLFDEYISFLSNQKDSRNKLITIGDVYINEKLFSAYPEISKLPIYLVWDESSEYVAFLATPINKNSPIKIYIKYNAHEDAKRNVRGSRRMAGRLSRKNIFTHELQHYVQVREGLSGGSSTLQEFDKLLESARRENKSREIGNAEQDYLLVKAQQNVLNSAGEIEAMDSEARINLNDNQRKIYMPYDAIKYDKDNVVVNIEVLEKGQQVCSSGTEIQTLVFDKARFKRSTSAIRWAKENDFDYSKIDTKENTYRIRQQEPEVFQEGSFRTIELTDGVKAVIGCPVEKTEKMEGGGEIGKEKEEHLDTLEKVKSREISPEEAVTEIVEAHHKTEENRFEQLVSEANSHLEQLKSTKEKYHERDALSAIHELEKLTFENPERYLQQFINFNSTLPKKYKYSADVLFSSKDETNPIITYLKETGKHPFEFYDIKRYSLPRAKSLKVSPEDSELMNIHSGIVATDNIRPLMSGTNFGERGAASTDAHVMLFTKYRNGDKFDGTYCYTKKCIEFNKGNIEGEKIGSGRFPNYQYATPDSEEYSKNINSEYLHSYLKNVENVEFYNPVTRATTLYFETSDGVFSVGLNTSFLIKVIDAMIKLGHKELSMSFVSHNRAVTILPKGMTNYDASNLNTDFALIMPLMLLGDSQTMLAYNLDTNCVKYNENDSEYCFDFEQVDKNKFKKEMEEVSKLKEQLKEEAELARIKKEQEKAIQGIGELQDEQEVLAEEKQFDEIPDIVEEEPMSTTADFDDWNQAIETLSQLVAEFPDDENVSEWKEAIETLELLKK